MNSGLDYKGAIIFIAIMAVEFILLAIFLPKLDKKLKLQEENIVKVIYLGTVPRKVRDTEGAGSSLLLYGLLATMVAAAMHPRIETYHRFSVHYDTGKVRTVECASDSEEYDKLMNHVRYFD